jgi:hypothetical protein
LAVVAALQWSLRFGTTTFAAVDSEGPARGVWTAGLSQWTSSDAGKATFVQLRLERRGLSRGSWNSSFPVPLSDLVGLKEGDLGAAKTDVRFELRRDAGTVSFDGRFDGGEGAGHFTFVSNPEYVQWLRSQGHGEADLDKLFSLAVHDVSRSFVSALAELGYRGLPLESLVKLRIHGASPEFIRELKALGYDQVPVEELVKLRIHGASPEFIRELKSLGYERLPVDSLVKLRIHGASPEFVRELKALGYEGLPVDTLVKMRIHGVTPDFIRRVARRGDAQVSTETLVNMRIHGEEP